VVEEPLRLLLSSSWITFSGILRDEMIRWTKLIAQHGFLSLWKQMHWYYHELQLRHTEKKAGFSGSKDPQPVSTDFEIIMIFPVCGILLALSLLVFLGEWSITFILVWRAIKDGAFGLGL
jgi:hypothetical protein